MHTLSNLASKQFDFEEVQRNQDEPGILKSRDYLDSLIKAEIEKGIDPSRIVLGGFSQGGAMSLFTGITSSHKLGGIFGLSCYLLLSTKIKEFSPQGELPNQNTPFFLAHGHMDPVVRYEFGDLSQERLKALGFDVEFRTYPCVYPLSNDYFKYFIRMLLNKVFDSELGHSADPDELEDLEKFLAKVLPPTTSETAGL